MRRLRLLSAAAVIAAGLVVAGCSAPAPGLDDQTSQEWQARVLAIAESAEAGDVTTALTDLDALAAETTQARTDGEISAERAAIIQQSIAAVRSDLETAVSVPVAPVPEESVVTDQPSTDTETPSDDKGNNGNKGDNGKKNDDNGNGNKGKDDD